ncbi:Asp23/Gls24 family envelope stress response protein [Streptomyces chrestomyceticus]|uniref:Asp23/Gls24 family envelope stress response protein n=1 Tax=Streptomyces chrestomyceticus TaxID=68185 RepID=UPI00067ABEA6
MDRAVVVEYGMSTPVIAAELRDHVSTATGERTGLEVVEVDIAVNDVHLCEGSMVERIEGRAR